MKKKIFITALLLSSFYKTECMMDLLRSCKENITENVRKYFENRHLLYRDGVTPLWWACKNNNPEIVEMLLENGADWSVNIRDKWQGYTPLLWACQNKNLRIIKLLFEHGAEKSVNVSSNTPRPFNGSTPLFMACCGVEDDDLLEMINLLLEKGAINSINTPENAGYKPLHKACQQGSSKIANVLIRNGASVNVLDQVGNTPLYTACAYCKENASEIIELLFKHGARKYINTPNQLGDTPFVYACRSGNLEAARLLVENGASYFVNILDKRCETLLSHICALGHTNLEMIQFLLENCTDGGANIGEINMAKIMASRANQAIKSYLQNIHNFQQTENKMEFITTQIFENDEYEYIQVTHSEENFYKASQKTKDILRFAFSSLFRDILCDPELVDDDFCDENLFDESLFFKLIALVSEQLLIKEAVLQTFKIDDKSLLERKNIVYFIEHAIEKIDLSLARSYSVLSKFTIYKSFLEDPREERYNFAFRVRGNRSDMKSVATSDRELCIPKSLMVNIYFS